MQLETYSESSVDIFILLLSSFLAMHVVLKNRAGVVRLLITLINLYLHCTVIPAY